MSRSDAGRRLLCASAASSSRSSGRALRSEGPGAGAQDRPSEREGALLPLSPRWPRFPSARRVPPPARDGCLPCPAHPARERRERCRRWPRQGAAPLPAGPRGLAQEPGTEGQLTPEDCGPERRPQPSPGWDRCGGTPDGAPRGPGASRSLPRALLSCVCRGPSNPWPPSASTELRPPVVLG